MVLSRPDVKVEVAFGSSPFIALDDASLVWTDITPYVELDKGISIQRRRANELDEPSPGTLSLTLDNTDGRFTRLNTSSPYYPNVKHNRLIRIRAFWDPTTSINLLTKQQATGGQITLDTLGFTVPSGTLAADTSSTTSQGTPADTTYVVVTDAAAAGFAIGDIISRPATSTFHRITATASAFGFTNLTVSPSFTTIVATGETIRRQRFRWDTGNQQTTGTRLVVGSSTTDTAGPQAISVTAGQTYTWSIYALRGTNAISVSPRILWYDSTGALLSESTGSTTALSTSFTRLTLTATAPANAILARPALANETIFNPVANIAYRGGATVAASGGTAATLYVTVPSTVQAGDALLLWTNLDDENATTTTPSGWTAVGNKQGLSSRSYLFRKVATAADAGSHVGVTMANLIKKSEVMLVAYSGTDTTNPVHQFANATESNYQLTHVTPNVTTTVANCWILSAVFDRSTTTSAWTQPGGDIKRVNVFCTGSNAPTGAISDNATAVAAGTYGTKTWTSNSQSDDATMWTVAVKPGTTSGASTGSVYVTGAQFEQAGSALTWTIPAGIYTRFVGHVDSWPTAWEGGFRALTTITATDRTKLLSDARIRDAITEQVFSASPIIYNPLNEDSGATGAANAATVAQPTIPIVSRGTVTDDMLQWAGGTGPGTDAQPALKLVPSSATVGKALRGTLTTPLGGDGVTGISIAICFNSTITSAGQRNVIGVDDGKATDNGVLSLLDMYFNPDLPRLRAHFAIDTTGVDVNAESTAQWHDGHTHMGVATVSLSGGSYSLKLYVDGVLRGTQTGSISITELPELSRWSIGCSVADAIQSLYSGVLSHAIGFNTELSATQISDLWDAASDGFAGDLPGARAQRIADWIGLTTTNFETGNEMLGSHPSSETTVLDAFKLIARSEGGVFLVSRDGYSTLQDRNHRANAISAFSVEASQLDKTMQWSEDPALIANEITVKYGADEVSASDQLSKDDYGEQNPGDIETILATGTQALDRANAYLTRYSQPISRPDAVEIEALTQPELFTPLLNLEVGSKYTITGLPTGAPATNVDLFIEGVGEDITHDSWRFGLDCSPASFDFGMILDHATRGLLDSNYLGW